jgi:hypothetical protein
MSMFGPSQQSGERPAIRGIDGMSYTASRSVDDAEVSLRQ